MHNNAPERQITGLILCGGAGQRMGGVDKGLIEFQGKPLVDIAIERLQPQVHEILISANRNTADYAERGFLVLQDHRFGQDQPCFDGPLAGILAGLTAMQTDWLMVVPCDCPRFPADIVAHLHRELKAAMHGRGSQASKIIFAAHVKDHPVFALLPRTAKSLLESYLASGQRKLGHWLSTIDAIAVTISDERAFQNMNTPQDLVQRK